MTNDEEILADINSWFASIRELDWVPNHFTVFPCSKEFFDARKEWIHKNIQGRYAWGMTQYSPRSEMIGFEDPNDATLYALIYPL